MRMRRVGLLVLNALLLSACGTCQRKIEVVGYARNAKLGAIIETDQDSIYYVEGKEWWNNHTLGMKLKVIGRLEVKNNKRKSNDTISYTEILHQNILHRVKIEPVK